MKKLIVVRHGHYTGGFAGGLSQGGVEQVYMLASRLLRHIGNNSAVIFSSPVKRAMESAAILLKCFHGEPRGEEAPCLCAADDYMPNPDGVLELLQNSSEDVVILVTHLSYMQDFAHFFGEKVLQTELPYYVVNEYASAVIIDCTSKSGQLISFDSPID